MSEVQSNGLSVEQNITLLKIQQKLASLGKEVSPLAQVSVGPILSVYRVIPKNKTKVSEVESCGEDLAIFLGVEDVVIKRLPGESSIAIFIPNKERTLVKFQDCITNYFTVANTSFKNFILVPKDTIPLILGVNHLGFFVYDDLTQLPHLLVAGSTNGGKSTLLNSIVAGFLYLKHPRDLQIYIADPKGVEFTNFKDAPHVQGIAVSIYEILEQMESLINETELRFKLFARYSGTKNIVDYNKLQEANNKDKLPYICYIIDELASLFDNKNSMEKPDGEKGRSPKIATIASDYLDKIVQKSRASGIHVIAATQRPSVNIVAGSIKANFPARLTFRLPSNHDSRTVINTEGAEHLLSRGDMLYISPNKNGIERLHAPFVTTQEVEAIIEISKYK